MLTFLICLSVIILLFALYVLCLKGNRKNPEAEYFTGVRYAHRGLHDKPKVPENSLSAFSLAVENGCGIELDIHLMADGELAVIHDASLKRTAGADIFIEDLTCDELKKYTLEDSDEHIPTLKEVLALVDGRVPLLIELKSEGNVKELCRTAIEQLKGYKGKYCVESFDPRCVAFFKKNAPCVVRGQLAENFFKDKNVKLSVVLKFFLHALVLNFYTRPDFIAYNFEHRKDLSNQIALKLWKIKGFAWTVRSITDMKQAESEGYTVIFENFDAN